MYIYLKLVRKAFLPLILMCFLMNYIWYSQLSAHILNQFLNCLMSNKILIKHYTEDVYHINLDLSQHCQIAVYL